MLSRMKYIDRWGLMNSTRKENISEHSLEVAVMIVKAMYITPSDNPIPTFRSDRCTKWGLARCTLGIIGLGIACLLYTSPDCLSCYCRYSSVLGLLLER